MSDRQRAAASAWQKSKIDLSPGTRFGRWTVLRPYAANPNKHFYALCRCDCGTEKLVRHQSLTGGHGTSCGCLLRDQPSSRTHGDTGKKLYMLWAGMLARCRDLKHVSFRYYGGRGISVCAEWMTYEPFRDWALSHGYGKGMSIDRKDNDRGYSPENCRFIPRGDQNRHTSRNRNRTGFGESKPLWAWAEDPRCVVRYGTLEYRLRHLKLPLEEALTTPVTPRSHNRTPN